MMEKKLLGEIWLDFLWKLETIFKISGRRDSLKVCFGGAF